MLRDTVSCVLDEVALTAIGLVTPMAVDPACANTSAAPTRQGGG